MAFAHIAVGNTKYFLAPAFNARRGPGGRHRSRLLSAASHALRTSSGSNEHIDTSLDEAAAMELWDRTFLLRRQLTLAVQEENYPAAARVKAELDSMVLRLPPGHRYVHRLLSRLSDHTSTIEARQDALRALAIHGDTSALAEISACSVHPALREEAESAIRAIRHSSTSPAAAELCQRGSSLLIALFTATGFPMTSAADSDDSPRETLTFMDYMKEREALGNTAVAVFTAALEEDPHCAAALAGRGVVHYHLGRHESAVDDLDSAVRLDPWHVTAVHMLALAKGQLKEFASARAALRSAAALNPLLARSAEHVAAMGTLQRWEWADKEWKRKFEENRSKARVAEEQRLALERALQASNDGEATE